jgi:glycosyltransferase involved in cell wall biosynthesis
MEEKKITSIRKDELTVVIPVYNAEKYICRCLDSLEKQYNIILKIIIVNDGSTDSTLEILQKYKELYNNIVIIDQKNQGTYMARLNGIRSVSTEFVTFCDADDYIDEDFYQYPLKMQRLSGADIVEFGCRRVKAGKIIREKIPKYDRLTGKQALISLFETRDIESYNCNKIYRTNLFEKNKLVDGIRMIVEEDRFLNVLIFANINLIVGCRKIGYNYELVEGSSTSVSRKYNGLREIQAQKIIFEYVSENLSLYKRSAAYDYCARLALCYIKFYITGDINMSNKVMKVFRKQCKNNKVILYFPRHASIKRICMLNVLYYTPGLLNFILKWVKKR